MAGNGGAAPRPYTQRFASTLFLRVPTGDWTQVKIGEKTEFRTMPGESSRLLKSYTPTPVVAYSITGSGVYDKKLMVLESWRREPLFEINNDLDALARENMASYDAFRRYWRARQHGVYRPLQIVHVWRVRQFLDKDIVAEGARLLRRLYGEFL